MSIKSRKSTQKARTDGRWWVLILENRENNIKERVFFLLSPSNFFSVCHCLIRKQFFLLEISFKNRWVKHSFLTTQQYLDYRFKLLWQLYMYVCKYVILKSARTEVAFPRHSQGIAACNPQNLECQVFLKQNTK